MRNESKSLVKNTAILSFGTLCTKGIMFLMTPLLTRWLTQSDYGTFDLIITYVTLLIPFITLDCGEAAFRFLVDETDNDDIRKKKVISSSLIVTSVGLIVSVVIGILLFFIPNSLKPFIPLFIVVLVSETLYQFSSYILRGFKQLPTYAVQNIIFVLLMSASSVVFIKGLHLELDGILLAYAVAYILSSVYAFIRTRLFGYIKVSHFDWSLTKEMLRFSLPLMPNAISWWIINVSDRSIVSALLGTANNAIYAVANKIPGLCQTLFGVFHLSWQENAIENMDIEERDNYFSSVFNKMVEVMGSICILMIACDFLFYKILFTEEYFLGYYHVPILVVSIIFSMMAQFFGGIYIARMESKKNGITTAMTAIVNLVVHLSLIKAIGLYAASISTFAAYFCLFIIRFVDIRRTIKISFSKKSIILFILMGYFFGTTYLNNMIINVLNLAISIIAAIVINRSIIVLATKGMLSRFKK